MSRARVVTAVTFVPLLASTLFSHPGPFDGRTFKGRIAYSADGNYNDADDWAASAVALAVLAECGVKDKLVHFDYNCILPKTDSDWEREHEASVLGAAERYGYPKGVFHDCQRDLEGAVASIAKAIDASSAEDPLYFILAGPMEVPALGIRRSDPARRRFVYCISHNRWNDGYASAALVHHNKRDIIPLGITWVQITDQNRFLSTSPYGRPAMASEWLPWRWMRDSRDPKVRFLWDRTRATTRADCSDAGMAYFLLTGDEEVEISKLRKLLDQKQVPTPSDPRTYVRIEAENFRTLDGYEVEYANDRRASQRISVRPTRTSGRIRTPFDEPYSAASGLYHVAVRYRAGPAKDCRLWLYVNGVRQGSPWSSSGDRREWSTRTIPDVNIESGDEIMVEVEGAEGDLGGVDYVQINRALPDGTAGQTGRRVRPAGAGRSG